MANTLEFANRREQENRSIRSSCYRPSNGLSIRKSFNESFTEEKYQAYLEELNAPHPGAIEFRVAETPIFCDKVFTGKMISACESIVDVMASPDFKKSSEKAIPADVRVPGENNFSIMHC